MRKTLATRPVARNLYRVLAVPALLAVLAAGVAGLRLAPTIHSAASSVTGHVQLVETCPSNNTHC